MSRYLERVQEILRNADSKKVASKKVCIHMYLLMFVLYHLILNFIILGQFLVKKGYIN